MEARGWKLIGWKLERQGACKRPTWRTERRRRNFRIHSGGRYSAPQKVWHLWSRFFSCCLFIYSGSSSAGPRSIENALIFFYFCLLAIPFRKSHHRRLLLWISPPSFSRCPVIWCCRRERRDGGRESNHIFTFSQTYYLFTFHGCVVKYLVLMQWEKVLNNSRAAPTSFLLFSKDFQTPSAPRLFHFIRYKWWRSNAIAFRLLALLTSFAVGGDKSHSVGCILGLSCRAGGPAARERESDRVFIKLTAAASTNLRQKSKKEAKAWPSS